MNLKTFALIGGILGLAACGYNQQNPEVLRGTNFVAAADGTNITLSFAPDADRINGEVVNLYNAQYTVDGGKIAFGPIATTMMMGPENAMETEREYLQFLSTVDCYEYDIDDGKLTLKNPSGKEIVFQQVSNAPQDASVVEVETVTVSQ